MPAIPEPLEPSSPSPDGDPGGPPRWLRAGMPLALAGAALAVDGYRFDTSDHAIHLTFVRRLMEPAAFAGDLVADHAASHPSLWWHLQVPLVHVAGWSQLWIVQLVLYVGALVATFVLLAKLARVLFCDPWAALIAPAALVVFKACPAHVHTFEPALINRTVAHPLLLWAVLELLRRRPIHAAAIAGLAFDLHATTASHVALALALAVLVDPALRRQGLLALGALCATAAPLLLGWAAAGGPSSWWVDEPWMHVLQWRMPHHLFPARWPAGVWAVAGAQLALWIVAARAIDDRATRRRAHALVAGVLLCGPLLGSVVAGPLPVAPLLALHLWEAWILLAVLAYLAGAALALRWLRAGGLARPVAGALLLGAVLAGGEGRLMGWREPRIWAPRAPAAERVALLDALESPRFTVSAGRSVLVPPRGMAWLRPWSGRALFVTVKDGGEAVFDREQALAWRWRMEQLCGEDVLAGDPPDGAWRGYRAVGERAAAAFARRSDAELRRLAARERSWLLVVPASMERPGLAPVHTDGAFFVYDLRHPSRH